MISNETRAQASVPVLVAKDNLKQTKTKGYLPENAYPYNARAGETIPLKLNVLKSTPMDGGKK